MRRSSLAARSRASLVSGSTRMPMFRLRIGFVVGLIAAGIRVGRPHMGRSERLEMSVAVFSLPSKAARERVAETHKDSDVVGRYAGGSDGWRWREALAAAERCKTFFASAHERPHDKELGAPGEPSCHVGPDLMGHGAAVWAMTSPSPWPPSSTSGRLVECSFHRRALKGGCHAADAGHRRRSCLGRPHARCGKRENADCAKRNPDECSF